MENNQPDYEYIRNALSYRYFVVILVEGQGERIHCGNEYKEDALDALKECREIHPEAKIKTRKTVGGEALRAFYVSALSV
jgi:hypothetical protein